MANVFEVHHQVGAAEQKKFVIAVDEPDVRAYLTKQETDGDIQAGWTIFDSGTVEATAGAVGPTQLTKDLATGTWLETA